MLAAVILLAAALPAWPANFAQVDADRNGIVTFDEAKRVMPELEKVSFDKFATPRSPGLTAGQFAALNNFYTLNYLQRD